MFEKEAEEYVDLSGNRNYTERAFKDGAEFGYNKANEELEEKYKETICNSELNLASITEQLEELEKANEWHKVADGDLPNTEREVLIFMWGSYYLGYYKQYDGEDSSWHFEDFDEESEQVIAWCEIPTFDKDQ